MKKYILLIISILNFNLSFGAAPAGAGDVVYGADAEEYHKYLNEHAAHAAATPAIAEAKAEPEHVAAYHKYLNECNEKIKHLKEHLHFPGLHKMIHEYACIPFEQWKENGKKLINLVRENNIKEAKKLLASLEPGEVDIDFMPDFYTGTALMVAARNGNKEMVELLLAHHANVNKKGIYNTSALSYAESNKHTEIAELLKKHGATEATE